MTDRKPRLDRTAVLLLTLCCALWGFNQVMAKQVLAEVPPLLQAGVRSLGAALVLLAWSAWRGIPLHPGRGLVWPGIGAGALFALEFGCLFAGLQLSSASRMSVLIYLAPFVVAMGMPWITRSERLGAGQWLGMAVAFGGVAWALTEGLGGAAAGGRAAAPPQQLWGDLLGVLAAVLWGATTLLVRATALSAAPPEQTLYCQVAVSAVLLLAASAAVGEAWPSPAGLSVRTWALLGFQIVVVTSASYLLWFWLVRHYPATQVSAFTMLTPIVGLWAGVALLGEPLTLRLLLACAAVVAGLVLVNRPPAAARAQAAASAKS